MKIYTSLVLCAVGLWQPAFAGGARFSSQPILAFGTAAVDARAINNDGTIVGSVNFSSGGSQTGFVLQGSTETALFGGCPGCTLFPTSINRTGVIAGLSGGSSGFVWKSGTVIASNLPLGNFQSGQGLPTVVLNTVGEVAYTDNTPTGSVVYAGVPGHAKAQKGLSASHTVVNSINNRGILAGFEIATVEGQPTPVIFFGKNGFFDMLQTNGFVSGGYINDAGQVAFADQYAAYVYSSGVRKTISLQAQQGSIAVQAINNRGRVVGTYVDTASMQHLFYYNGISVSTYGAYPPSDVLHVALNDRNVMVISDRPTNTYLPASYRVACFGPSC